MMALTKSFFPILALLIAIYVMAVSVAQKPAISVAIIPVTGEDNLDFGDKYFASHADERHPAEAQQVRDCISSKGIHSLWQEPSRGTYLQLCQLDNGKYGVRVCKSESCSMADEITAFIKEKFNYWDQVAKYLQNNGAVRVR